MPEQLRSRSAVLRAAREFDELGRAAFLDKYGFRSAKRYLLRIDGRLYDSKAIVGVAYGVEHPQHGPLRSDEFSGGMGGMGAARQLLQLGFEIVDEEPSDHVATGDDGTGPVDVEPTDLSRKTSPPLFRPVLSQTLVVLPCSARKRHVVDGPPSGSSVLDAVDRRVADELAAARRRIAGRGFDERTLAVAHRRYEGALYDAAGSTLAHAIDAGATIAILSGGYGVVLADEPIGTYDRRFKPGDWPNKIAGRVLASLATRRQVTEVVAFLARTTSYAEVVRTAPWPPEVQRVELISVDHRGGGGMRIVPATLGEAVAEYLSGGLAEGWVSSRGIGITVEDVRRRRISPEDAEVESGRVAEALRSAARHRPGDFERDRSLYPHAGLYAWYGDEIARARIHETLGQPVGELLYVGQAGATRWPSGSASTATLGSRIRSQHIGGNTGSSTLRRTLAAALAAPLGLHAIEGRLDAAGEERLRDFVRQHMTVSVLPMADRTGLSAIEAAVVARLDPPLNLDHVQTTPLRAQLSAQRSRMFGRNSRHPGCTAAVDGRSR